MPHRRPRLRGRRLMPVRRTRVSAGRFTRTQRQPSTWARLTSPAPIIVPAASKVFIATFALANPGIGETVRRTRGLISISSDQFAAAEEQTGAFGMIVVNDLAAAAGAASIPSPVAEGSDDGWFVWVPFSQSLSSLESTNSWQYEFDSKAMRRVEEGFIIALMVENAHADDGLRIMVNLSLLSSLS